MTASLARPSAQYKNSFIAAVREFQAEGRYLDYVIPTLNVEFERVVQSLLDKRDHPPPGRVPETVYWLVDNDEFIGRVSLRHELNESLRQLGGHIGYDIRPSKRRHGYGTLACRLALEKAREIGLRRVLITCDATNIASRKIIEANGGQLQDERLLPGRTIPTRRYWVELDTT
jgi:predicted acetyltransferase